MCITAESGYFSTLYRWGAGPGNYSGSADGTPRMNQHEVIPGEIIFKKIRDPNDDVFKMILIGLISLLLMQAFVHVGVNLRVLPTTGMTLPYLSYGGSSIISISIISGIILNLTKRRVY